MRNVGQMTIEKTHPGLFQIVKLKKAQLNDQLKSIRAASGRSQKTPDKPKTPAEKKAELLKKFSISDDLLLKQQETDASEPIFAQSESGNA